MATSAAIWTLPRVPDDIKRLRVGADCSIFPVSPIIVSNQRAGGSYKKHMDTLWRDVCFGLRLLAKNKGFAAVAVLALALGIGPNTAIFSVIYATLLAPMPYPQPDQLVVVWSKIQGSRNVVSAGDFLDWQHESKAFQGIGAASGSQFNLATAQEPEQVSAQTSTPGFLGIFGYTPLLPVILVIIVRTDVRDALWAKQLRQSVGDGGLAGSAIAYNAQEYRSLRHDLSLLAGGASHSEPKPL